jgi:hypothetical protein
MRSVAGAKEGQILPALHYGCFAVVLFFAQTRAKKCTKNAPKTTPGPITQENSEVLEIKPLRTWIGLLLGGRSRVCQLAP